MKENQVSSQVPLQQKVRIFLDHALIFELELGQCECIGEIKHVLMQNPWISLHPNFKMSLAGRELNEFDNLAEQVTEDGKAIDVKIEFCEFSNMTAKQHVYNLACFFEDPDSYLADKFVEFNILQGKTEFIQQSINSQVLEVKEISLEKCLDHDLNLLNHISFFDEKKTKKNLFFKEFSYAKFNPPLGKAKMNGDIFYLKLVTNEAKEVFLTMNKKGCFTNKSTNEKFDPTPSSKIFNSLIELLSILSQDFNSTLENYYNTGNQYLYKKWSEEMHITSKKNLKSQWVSNFEKFDSRNIHLKNLQDILKNEFAGQVLSQYRDWNEEFQNQKLIGKGDTIQAIQKIQLMYKIQEDFLNASRKLASAVVNEDIVPVNLTDKKFEKCFVFNNLFATYAIDSLDWELPKNENTPSTYSAVNNDLMNLKYLNSLENDKINSINTCTVDYLGNRIIIQTVIQGILHFDQKTWNCYGSIDDGKTMNWNQEFHDLMSQVCEHFKLSKDNKFKDESGKEFNFHGSPEVKGITAGDGRKYIMDLMRLTPRDANYEDPKKHECCVLRPELIKSFFYVQEQEKNLKSFTDYQKKIQKIKQEELENKEKSEDQKTEEKQEEQKNEKTKNEDNKNEENKNEENQRKKSQEKQPELNQDSNQNQKELENEQEKNVSETKQSEQKIEGSSEENQPHYIENLDPSILTLIECEGEKDQKLKDLQYIAKFLKEKMINIFIDNISNNPLVMASDNETLIDTLHNNGINVRYLGLIHEKSKSIKNFYLTKLIERTIFVRSFNKFLREVAVDEAKEVFLHIFIYFINLIFGNQIVRNNLNKAEAEFQKQNQKNDLIKKSKKKKKNKKNKKNEIVNNSSDQIQSKYLKYNSSQIYAQIQHIAKNRYGLEFEETYIQDLTFITTDKEKITMIREICKKLGIVLLPKKYHFNQSTPPFQVSDISDIIFKLKFAEVNTDYLKYNYKQIENDIMNQKHEQAYQLLKASQQMIINTQGIYNEDFISNLTRLSNFYFLTKKIDIAVKTQIFALKLSQKFLGIDHPKTALAILDLSNYLFEQKKIDQAVNLHSIALYLFDLISSPYNPNSLFCLHELQILSEQQQNKAQSIDLTKILLERHEKLFGETDERLLYFLSKLASQQADLKNYDQASLLQARHFLILKRLSQNPLINNMYKNNIKMKLDESSLLRDQYMKKRTSGK